MAKNPFDSFSKQLLEEVLSPYGAVEVSREVPGESQFVNVYFEPSSPMALTSSPAPSRRLTISTAVYSAFHWLHY
jgi:hypothetical protein